MHTAVPDEVHEAHDLLCLARTHPAQAVPIHLGPPIVGEQGMGESLRVQPVDGIVVERVAPSIGDVVHDERDATLSA